ncbi:MULTISPECIES: VOC family protein [Bradyrhizobium]|uniref:VOC family protein n=1 Tax=Bradyrhizobium TaxID=374 RepID=UPI000464621F|nr:MULTISPECIES: VOC family protein [Bradyrhizobium]KIU42911.1 riboflavin deaminase [Bradyrhizobium elkanii]OCX31203.1 riboflavin deaminase [Bradyrhizobium sp. UASWS1016]
MLKLDHLTVIAPNLAEGVAHIRACLDLDVPFGQRHDYMGTHNHLLRLGGSVYLEIVAVDPDAQRPLRARWFGLDDRKRVTTEWDAGRRLRGWVARTDVMDGMLARWGDIFGSKVALPPANSTFDFAIPDNGSLPLDGAAPSLIDRRGKERSMANIADLGARLISFSLQHPEATSISEFYRTLDIDQPPTILHGSDLRYRARVETQGRLRELS